MRPAIDNQAPRAGGRVDSVLALALCTFIASIPFDVPERGIPIDVPTATGALLLFAAVCSGGARWSLPAAFLWFAAYLYVGLLSTLHAGANHLQESVKLILQILQPMLIMLVVYNAARVPKLSRMILWTFVAACTCRAAAQVLGVGTTSLGRWEMEERLTAWGQNPNNASANLILGLLILIGMELANCRRRILRLLTAGGAALIGIAVIQMGSRGAILGLLAGLLTLSLLPLRRVHTGTLTRLTAGIVLTAAFAAMCYLSPSTRTRFEQTLKAGHMSGRDELYSALADMFLEKPWFGWGIVESQYELARRAQSDPRVTFVRRDSHNMLFEVSVTTGIVGLTFFLAGLATCVAHAWRARHGPYGALPAALLVALMVINMTQDWLPANMNWVVLGYVLASGAAQYQITGEVPANVPIAGVSGASVRPSAVRT